MAGKTDVKPIKVRKNAKPDDLARVVEMYLGQSGKAVLVALGEDAATAAFGAVDTVTRNLFGALKRLAVAGMYDGNGNASLNVTITPYQPEDFKGNVPPYGVRLEVEKR